MNEGGPPPYHKDAQTADLTRYLDRLVPAASESVYDRLVGFGFARRYVEGKTVAVIGWEEVGYGSRLLAGTAESLVGLTTSTEALDLARTTYPAPNVSYEKTDLPEKLPYPEEHFDVVVAFGVVEYLEQPEDLVREARRVLKGDGVLLVSVPDKRVSADDRGGARRRTGMYVPEFQERLEPHFEHVRVYRLGAVAGGSVFPVSGDVSGAFVESASLSPIDPRFGAEPPATRSVVAVCAAGVLEQDERPYLLLDRDRRIFDEYEDRIEDVELLRDEIQRMQETEVQVFRDALRLRVSEIAYLRARIRRSDAEIHGLKNQIHGLRNHIKDMESSTTWRLFEPYRQLRARLDARGKPAPESTEGSDDHR
jgi:SAM-dependent methyltransferase